MIKKLIRNNTLIVKNTGWLFFEKVYKSVFSFFVAALVIRYLGPNQFGEFSAVIALVALLEPFVDLGASSIVVKDLVEEKFKKTNILGSVFFVKLLLSIFSILSLNLFSYFVYLDPLTRILIGVGSLQLFFKCFEIIDSTFQKDLKSKKTVLSKTIAFNIVALLKIYAVYSNKTLVFFMSLQSLELFLVTIGLVYFYCKTYTDLKAWRVSLLYLRTFIPKCLPLFFASVSVLVYMRIDQVMLKNMIGNEATGVYSAALKLTEVWFFIPVAIVSSFFPSIVGIKNLDPIHYERRIRKLYSLLSGIALGLVISGYFLGPFLIPLLFSKKYILSIPIFQIHIWSLIFVFWGVLQNAWDTAEDLMNYVLFRCSVSALLNVVMNIIFIKKYGAIGAAYATLCAYILSSSVLNIFLKKNKKVMFIQMKSLFFWTAFRDDS